VAEQKPASKKKGCLGCSLPLAISLTVVVVAVSVFGIINGAFGKKLVPAPEVKLPAEAIFHIGVFPVTNTLITSWITMLVLMLIALLVTNRSKLIPGRLQGAVEAIIEYMYNFCKDVAGEKNGRKFFPVVTTIFLFVLLNALMNLIPGYGTITMNTEEGVVPLLRGANTDINTALSLALISFVCVTFWGIKANKAGFFKTFFNFGRFFKGWGQVFTGKAKAGCGSVVFGLIDIFVGVLELFSYFIRIVSFTFRLFGNMTGGEILILILFFLFGFSGVSSIAYAFEMLVGVVQALIFAGLTLVFATMATEEHEGEEHASK
jgi:F-type H+-transporting ATPase subunit a